MGFQHQTRGWQSEYDNQNFLLKMPNVPTSMNDETEHNTRRVYLILLDVILASIEIPNILSPLRFRISITSSILFQSNIELSISIYLLGHKIVTKILIVFRKVKVVKDDTAKLAKTYQMQVKM